jgi:small conductance mechanosensitive channel
LIKRKKREFYAFLICKEKEAVLNPANILSTLWNSYSDDLLLLLKRLLTAATIIVIGKLIVMAVKRLIKHAVEGKFKFNETLAPILKTTISYAVVIVCAIIILDVFGINTTSLIAMLGAAGVAVGLAIKDTLSNIAAGIVLLIQNPCRKGDFIEFGAISGTVCEINLFSTVLETVDGVYISSPNSAIWGTPLKNYTRNGRRRMDLIVGIAYEDSIAAAFKVMEEIIAEEKRFLPDPAPQIMVQSLGASSVNIMLRAWADGSDYWDLYWDKIRSLKEKIEAAGLHIPFNQIDLNYKGPLPEDTGRNKKRPPHP